MVAVSFVNLPDFVSHFPGVGTGTNRGLWRFDSTGSSSSSNTGPGSNNNLPFAHTETSNGQSVDLMRANGLAQFGTVPAGVDRTLRLRMCLQGVTSMRGMAIETSPDGGVWTERGFFRAWAFDNGRDVGDTFNNYDGETLTCVADGGWVDWTIPIPDGANQVRLAPRYDGTNIRQDQALREFDWGAAAPPVTPPDTPTGLTVVSKTHNEIVVSWSAVSNTDSYTVRLDGVDTAGIVGTSHHFTGLDPSTTYQIAVAAVNTEGSSAFTSNLQVVTNAPPAPPPDTPTGLAVVSKTHNEIVVSWDADPDADMYTVRIDGAQTPGIVTTTHTFMGLGGSIVYQVAVSASNEGGSSPFTSNLAVTTDPTPVAAPATPTGLSVLSKSHNRITVGWDAVSNADTYTVRIDGMATHGIVARVHTFAGLAPSTTYQVSVRAVNEAGGSGFAPNLAVFTNEPPPPPSLPPRDPSRSPHMAISAAYELVDSEGRVTDDITGLVSADHAGHIKRVLCAPIPGLAKFTILGNIHWPTARIRITETLRDTITGSSVSAHLGVYVPTTPDRIVGPRDADVFNVHGVDIMYFLDQPLDRSWQVMDGAPLADTIADLVAAGGVPLKVRLAPVSGTIRGARIWPLHEEYTWLGVANDLLRSASWNDLYSLGDGTITSEPWQPASQLSPVLHIDGTAPDTVLAETARLREDTFGVPNQWVVVDPNLAVEGFWPVEGAGVVTVRNQSDGPTSIDQRGYVRTRRVQTEADSQAVLSEIALRESISDRRPSQQICATVTPVVDVWHGDVVEVTDPRVGLDRARMLVASFMTPLQKGTDMRMELERI